MRGGGHNVAGRATTDGGLMIDLSLMKGIHVDPQARTARAQGGATWSEFNRETQLHGLATTGGVVSTTGIAGLTLGGGLGWLMGKYGLALDNLLSVDLVTGRRQSSRRARTSTPTCSGRCAAAAATSASRPLRVPAAPGRADGHRRPRSPIRSPQPGTCSASTATSRASLPDEFTVFAG